jgi:hypothetical protein
MYLGWKTWLKYQHFFTGTSYLLWAEKSPWIENAEVILLINKKLFSSLIEHHQNDFQEDAEFLLKEAKNKPFLMEVLHKHEGLIGILLGYGKTNARLFWERQRGRQINISCVWEKEVEQQMLTQLNFWHSLFASHHRKIEDDLFYPSFMGDPNSLETQTLKEEYRMTRDRIIHYYQGTDCLEASLRLLTTP